MLCWLCNEVEVSEIILDAKDGKIRNCSVCEAVIQQNLQDISRSVLGDDEGELPVIEEDFDEEDLHDTPEDLLKPKDEDGDLLPMAYQRGFWPNG